MRGYSHPKSFKPVSQQTFMYVLNASWPLANFCKVDTYVSVTIIKVQRVCNVIIVTCSLDKTVYMDCKKPCKIVKLFYNVTSFQHIGQLYVWQYYGPGSAL